MGITYLQHRVVTGSFAVNRSNENHVSSKRINGKCNLNKNEVVMIMYGIVCVTYVYMICLLLAGAIVTSSDMPVTKLHRSYDIGSNMLNSWYGTLNCAIILLLRLLYVRRGNYIFKWIVKHGNPSYFFSKYKNNCTKMQSASNQFTIWTTMLNLLLVVICNPSILNPGPNNQLKVMYQNVRGFVPFSGLGKSIMPLNNDKILEFQSKVFEDKPDVIVLTETWLSKEHFNSEILPDALYKIYRKDRSKRSHPPDPNNHKKFREKGGGVLVAIKADIDLEFDKVNVSSKAEMMSVNLKSQSINYCISVCYRVGTLGIENFNEIEQHLKNVVSQKKFKAHFVVGDFNLPDVSWSIGYSPTELGRKFIDLFNNFGLQQLIDQPTHDKGKTLDLLFSNLVGAVENITVLDKNEICSSDHYGITFNIKMKFRTKVGKRKIFNYKKADWQNLNKDLKSVKWDQHLNCDAELGWLRFKNILSHFMNIHIPTITLKNSSQPPWFDCDTHQLCLKKERLRSKYKETGLADDYNKFSVSKKFQKFGQTEDGCQF